MQSTIFTWLLAVTLINPMVDCTRTPKQGHVMLSGISLEPTEFERQVIEAANHIEQLQLTEETRSNSSVQRYILPVLLYVHEASRISQSPVYLALNVQPSAQHARDFPNYLQLVDIYDERYHQPLVQISPLTTVTYPNKITPFNPIQEVDRHSVIAGLQDPKKRHEVMARLSLIFVESIRFYSVRRAVQQALQVRGAVDFNVHLPVIRQWEATTNDLVHLLQTNSNKYIEADQKLDPRTSQNVFSVSVFHLNAAAQMNMWLLYQFVRCNSQYHQQAQDGDGSCDVDTWSETKWRVGCTNMNGGDVAVGNVNLQRCAQMCQRTASCTHFSWKKNDCYLKNGRVVATDQKKTYDTHEICGYKRSQGKNDQSDISMELNSAYDDGDHATHVPANSAADCYGQCHRNGSCQAFTWHEQQTHGGECYLQSGVGKTPHHAVGYISGHRLERNIIKNRLNRFRRGHQVSPGPHGSLKVTSGSGPDLYVSNRYGWSAHNCNHGVRKTGLVLYPTGTRYKNIVLLVCESCFGYKSSNSGTQHQQLHNWYYGLYGESKSFSMVSGFSQKDDHSLGFNSYSFNAAGPYTDNSNTMNSFEQNAIGRVVNGKLDSYSST